MLRHSISLRKRVKLHFGRKMVNFYLFRLWTNQQTFYDDTTTETISICTHLLYKLHHYYLIIEVITTFIVHYHRILKRMEEYGWMEDGWRRMEESGGRYTTWYSMWKMCGCGRLLSPGTSVV